MIPRKRRAYLAKKKTVKQAVKKKRNQTGKPASVEEISPIDEAKKAEIKASRLERKRLKKEKKERLKKEKAAKAELAKETAAPKEDLTMDADPEEAKPVEVNEETKENESAEVENPVNTDNTGHDAGLQEDENFIPEY